MNGYTRQLIVVNKYWECDPVCWVLTNKYLFDTCNVLLPWPSLTNYPSYGPVTAQPAAPRMIYTQGNLQAEVWCISDLMSKYSPEYQSSSEYKMKVLGNIFSYSSNPVNLVAAIGTASSGPFCPEYEGSRQDNINGSVIVGTKIFMHDAHPESDPNPYSKWRCAYFDQLMNSSLTGNDMLTNLTSSGIETALLCPPNNPATNGQRLYVNSEYTAIGDENVTDYNEYKKKDAEAGRAFTTCYPDNDNGVSVETTHGLIYAAAREYFKGDPPFLFISGVVDRFTKFDVDVNPSVYAQNVIGAHNAGVCVALLLSDIMKQS